MIKKTVSNFVELCPPEDMKGYSTLLQSSCFQCNQPLKPNDRYGFILWQDFYSTSSRVVNILWFCSKKHRKQWITDNNRPEQSEITASDETP